MRHACLTLNDCCLLRRLQVLPCLSRTFHGALRSLKPQMLRIDPDGAAGGVLVCRAIQNACLTGAEDHNDTMSALPVETLSRSSFSRTCRSNSISSSAAVRDTTLDDLYTVYSQVFRASTLSSTGSFREDVQRLISVLMAAQEPLPFSFLQQLGLGEAISALPGYPTLFFMDEHHLYTLHKSLGEWWVATCNLGRGSMSLAWRTVAMMHDGMPDAARTRAQRGGVHGVGDGTSTAMLQAVAMTASVTSHLMQVAGQAAQQALHR